MRRAATLLFAIATPLAACAHHNVVRNAGALYAEADVHRRTGDAEAAALRYSDVVRKTAEALRERPGSEWGDEARLLLARAHYRLGNLREARAALEATERSAGDPAVAGAVQVYLALVEESLGQQTEALTRVERAFEAPLRSDVLAEARLLQARLEGRRGSDDRSWWALDRAIDADRGTRVEAVLTGLRASLAAQDPERSAAALARVLEERDAGARVDEVELLLVEATDRWGAVPTLQLLDALDESRWPRGPLGQLQLLRARFLYSIGEIGSARALAERVQRGLDTSAVEARLLLSEWQAATVRDLAGLAAVRTQLLPGAAEATVARRLQAIDALEAHVETGLDDPLAWYLAAEVARDELGADFLARGLFLAYADAATDEPWVPKALLAALDVSAQEGDRAWLRGRLEAYAGSPYVLAAQGVSAIGLEELEAALGARLTDVTQR